MSAAGDYRVYVVVVTPLPVESDAVRKFIALRSKDVGASGTRYEEGLFQNVSVVHLETGPGNAEAAIEVERAVEKHKPRYLFFIGVAGGIKDVKIGDVVAATKIYNCESGKASSEFLARPKMGESSYFLVQLAKSVARSERWKNNVPEAADAKAYVAPLVAGEKVITSLEANELAVIRKTYSDALAVEMEGFGVLRVGYSREQIRMIVIRAVSDLLEGKSTADAGGSQPLASAAAAAFAFQMLSDLLDESQPIPESSWEALEAIAVSLLSPRPDAASGLDTGRWGPLGVGADAKRQECLAQCGHSSEKWRGWKTN